MFHQYITFYYLLTPYCKVISDLILKMYWRRTCYSSVINFPIKTFTSWNSNTCLAAAPAILSTMPRSSFVESEYCCAVSCACDNTWSRLTKVKLSHFLLSTGNTVEFEEKLTVPLVSDSCLNLRCIVDEDYQNNN